MSACLSFDFLSALVLGSSFQPDISYDPASDSA